MMTRALAGPSPKRRGSILRSVATKDLARVILGSSPRSIASLWIDPRLFGEGLAVGAFFLAGAAWADCGAHIVCDSAENDGNELAYCESKERQEISSLVGHHEGVNLGDPFSVAGDPIVFGTFKGEGFVGVQFPGWGIVGGRGPLIPSAHGNQAMSLAWIEVAHEAAGEALPLADARVTVQLATGCILARPLVFEHCQLLRWD